LKINDKLNIVHKYTNANLSNDIASVDAKNDYKYLDQYLSSDINVSRLIADELRILDIDPELGSLESLKEIKSKINVLINEKANDEQRCLGYLLLSNILMAYLIRVIRSLLDSDDFNTHKV